MKLFRFIPVCIAGMALILVHAQPASQSEQAAGAATKPEKKARTKGKKAAEQTGDVTGKSGVSATETTRGTKGAGITERSASQGPETPTTRKARTATTGSAARAVPTVSESEIAAAKASGKVWVNTETGVYHKGGRWYGTTKQGKFMTEEEATRAGYKASKAK